MVMDTPVVAYMDMCVVDETGARTFAHAVHFQEQHQGDGYLLFKLHKTVVGKQSRETVFVMDAYVLEVEMLEIGEMPYVKGNKDSDDFTV